MKRILALFLFPCAFAGMPANAQDTLQLGLPIACTPGEDCFLQQYVDLDTGSGVSDPFCGRATYNGHKGTDIRVPTLADAKKGVSVIAAADGTVLRIRDGEPDRLMRSEADRKAVEDKECGNGVVIDHGGGWETQYCHMLQGSIAVREGQRVRAGEALGGVGASGMAQFAHVHLTVRKDGKDIDPFTGRMLGDACDSGDNRDGSLWTVAARKAIDVEPTQIVMTGLAGGPVDHAALFEARPDDPTASSPNIVGWASVINLDAGDRISIVLNSPDGAALARQTTDALDRPKATYTLFAGKKGSPPAGTYGLLVEVLRDGKPVASARREFTVN